MPKKVKIDLFEVKLEHKDKFIWDKNKTLKSGTLTFDMRWNFSEEEITSEANEFVKPMTYNLSKVSPSDQLCSKGFYSNYNPFSTADFFKRFSRKS